MLEWFIRTVERVMTDAAVTQIIAGIIQREGDAYTNDPNDSGGPTKYGVTQQALSSFRGKLVLPSDVEALQEPEAALIYRNLYYIKPRFNDVATRSDSIALALVDAGVNCGIGTAGKFLQRSLNVFNNGGKLYPDTVVDGAVGDGTIAALNAFLAQRGINGAAVLLRAIQCLHGAYYIDLAEHTPVDENFVYGWINQRVVLA